MKFHFDGLSARDVEHARATHGANELPPPEVETFLEKLWGNFDDPLIKILCVALAVTLFLAALGFCEWYEGVGIMVAVFLATFVATYSEFKNEASFQELQLEASRVESRVFRAGALESLLVHEIVVGDLVLLQAGDKVPADGELVAGSCDCVQAALTGEPDALRKTVPGSDASGASSSVNDIDFSDPHRLFRGAVVDDGEAVMRVDAVGLATQYGKLFNELSSRDDERESPLQVKLSNLADGISFIGYVGATFIAVSFLFKQFVMDNNYEWVQIVAYASNWQLALKDVVTSLILAIIIIVVAVPEGLPMMIAIVLSLNMRKLLKANVLVRKLLGIETAGSLNLLFLDKTGTITRGRFDAQLFMGADGARYKTHREMPSALRELVAMTLRESTSAAVSADGTFVGGNASDRALIEFLDAASLGAKASEGVQLTAEILFSSVHKFSAAQVELSAARARELPSAAFDARRRSISLVKGAPEVLIAHCRNFLDGDGQVRALDPALIDADIDELSADGLRVVAVACCGAPLDVERRELPDDLLLLGCIGILDETRPESRQAVERCRSAGIQLVMITGDRQKTADAVARDIRLHLDADGTPRESITSAALARMSDDDVKRMLPQLAVVARALPVDKSRLVRLAQETGRVVGMTGDGVNDSSALKRADVGFAMGSGSEVAKEAADIVILDDNFHSIAQAVLYGRTIFRSIRKFIVFQSTVNLSSSLIVFLGPFLGFDFPLTLIQLLWVNLVMDTFAAIAFGGEPALERYMRQTPIPRDAQVISPSMWSSIVFNGFYIAFVCILFLIWPPARQLYRPDEAVFLTAFFCLFIFLTSANSFNVRTSRLNIAHNLLKNPGFLGIQALIVVVQIAFTVIGGKVLRTVALTSDEWATTIALAASIIPFDLLRKVVFLPFSGDKQKRE